MRYARKRDDDSMEWHLDEERAREKVVRVRRREAPSPRATRKMAKIDAEMLALAARRDDPRQSMLPTSPPPAPASRAAGVPPPLPIPFPFPFANSASSAMPSLAVMGAIGNVGNVEINAMLPLGSREDSFVSVRDSWLLPPRPTVMPATGTYLSLVPSEPDPFTVFPPAFSLPPR